LKKKLFRIATVRVCFLSTVFAFFYRYIVRKNSTFGCNIRESIHEIFFSRTTLLTRDRERERLVAKNNQLIIIRIRRKLYITKLWHSRAFFYHTKWWVIGNSGYC